LETETPPGPPTGRTPRWLRLRRSLWRAALTAAVLGFYAYVVWRGANRGSDFKYPYGAARLLWRTGALHVLAQPRYPLTLHVLLAPLAALPIGAAAAVWAALSFAAVAALPAAFRRLTDVEPRRQAVVWLAVAPFLVDALILGQSDPINLLLVASGLAAARRGRSAVGAALIGLAGLIKILPALQLATLAALGRVRGAAAGVALTAALGYGLAALAVGPAPALAGFRAQADWIANREKPWHLVDRGTDLRANNESLPVVLARTFGDLRPGLRDRRAVVLARRPLGQVWAAWYVTVAALGCGWLASVGPARRVDQARGWLGLFALGAIGMLALTPICWYHYFLWTAPALLFLADRPWRVAAAGVAGLLGSAPAARGLGVHMAIALVLFAAVAAGLRREARVGRPRSDRVEPGGGLSGRGRPST